MGSWFFGAYSATYYFVPNGTVGTSYNREVKKVCHWTANSIFVLHVFLGIFFLVGWMFPSINLIYLPLLVAWPFSWMFLGYCPLTKWELLLRKRYNPAIDTNAEAIQYNVKKYFGVHLPSRPIYIGGITVFFILLALSIGLNFF